MVKPSPSLFLMFISSVSQSVSQYSSVECFWQFLLRWPTLPHWQQAGCSILLYLVLGEHGLLGALTLCTCVAAAYQPRLSSLLTGSWLFLECWPFCIQCWMFSLSDSWRQSLLSVCGYWLLQNVQAIVCWTLECVRLLCRLPPT